MEQATDLISKEQMTRLEQYPNLKEYVDYFYNDNYDKIQCGDSKMIKKDLLIIWVRRNIDQDNNSFSADYYFDFDEETAEDFYSWGHNSRWWHTFYSFLEIDIEHNVDCLLDIADEFGDKKIEYTEIKE